MSQDFIIKVRVLLAKHQKSQSWLAEQLGLSDTYVSDIMNGRRKPDKQLEPIETILSALEKNKPKGEGY